MKRIPKSISISGSLLVLAALLPLAGCQYDRPHFGYQASGDVTSFKRYERFPQLDFFHHFSKQVYKATGEKFNGSSHDQETIITEWGKPDYVRGNFLSMEDERVKEWVYLDHRKVFQFIKGELVFDGPLTDLEQVFMQYGYPDSATTQIDEAGTVLHALVYRSVMSANRLETFYLSNGKLVHESVGS